MITSEKTREKRQVVANRNPNLMAVAPVENADGSEVVNLSNNPASDWDPAWSPDGTRIAYSSSRDGNDEIYVANLQSGEV